MQVGPAQKGQHKSLACCVVERSLEKEEGKDEAGLDPRLVAHTLNVDPEARPMAQPARIFHTEIEGQIVKEVQKLLAAGFIKPI